MATSSYKSFLMMKGTGTGSAAWTKLVDIKDYPDLGGEPELLETTTLSDPIQTNILGIQSMDSMAFTANYTSADYATLKALEGSEHDFAVWFGGTETNGVPTPTGSEGKFEFSGQLTVYVLGKGVNEVREMQISIAASTAITSPSSNTGTNP